MDGGLSQGEVIGGRYRILRPLGHGGSGTTYAAEAMGRGQVVALKRFRLKGASSWKALELFEREARVLASLRHPGIPAYLESFTIEGPEGPDFFLAQTLAEGQSLAAWVQSGARLGEPDVRRIAEELLVALMYLHGLNPPVVHRDIKPANIVMSAEGRLALVDFGAVREATVDSHIGGSTVVGTYGFMAPEQFRGMATPASDLYGLGATLVFLLTHVSPDRLPQKKLRPQLSSSLSLSKHFRAWIEKLLEPAPEDRYHNAREALTSLRSGHVAKAGSSSRVGILAAILAVAVVGGGGIAFRMSHRPIKTSTVLATAPQPRGAALLPEPPRSRVDQLVSKKFFVAHTNLIASLDLSPDSKILATASSDTTVKLWSTSDWSLLHSFSFGGRANGVGFTKDGKYLITSAADGTLHMWDVASGASVRDVTLSDPLRCLAISPSGDSVVVAGERGLIAAFSLPDLKPLWSVDASPTGKRLLAVAFSRDGSQVATGGEDNTVTLRSSSDGKSPVERAGHSATVDQIAFLPDDTRIASVGDDGNLILWNRAVASRKLNLHISPTEVWELAINKDGTEIFTLDKNGVLEGRGLPDNELRTRWETGVGGSALQVSSDGKLLYVGRMNGTVQVLSILDTEGETKLPESAKDLPDQMKWPDADTLARQAYMMRHAAVSNDASSKAKAEALIVQALAANPNDALALTQMGSITVSRAYVRGETYRKEGLDEARKYFDKALAANPKLADVHIELGRLLYHYATTAAAGRKEGDEGKTPFDLTDARKEADLAGATDPAATRADLLRSELALAEGKTDEALEHATRAVEAAPDRGFERGGYAELLDVYRKMGRFRAVSATYERELALKPSDAWEHGNYAEFLLAWGHVNEAKDEADKALALASYGAGHATRSECAANRGIALLWEFGDPAEDARVEFEKALKENPNSPDAQYGLVAVDAVAASAKGEACATCETRLRNIVQKHPDYVTAQSALKQLLR